MIQRMGTGLRVIPASSIHVLGFARAAREERGKGDSSARMQPSSLPYHSTPRYRGQTPDSTVGF